MAILSNFAENLFELMQERGLNGSALGKLLKTDRTNITRYLRGEQLPTYQSFVKLVEFFNVSADVLLGRTDYCDVKDFCPAQPFSVTFRKVLNETKTSQYRLQKDLRLSTATTFTWLTNKRIPSVEYLAMLAEYFDLSVDYLLGRIR